MADKNDFSEIIAEMLIKQDRTNQILEQLAQRQEQTQTNFNTAFSAILAKMDEFTQEVKGLRNDFQQFTNHEERLRKIEEIVFKRGA